MSLSRRGFIAAAIGLGALGIVSRVRASSKKSGRRFEVEKTDAEWKALLGPAAFHVLREEGTERPGSSPLLNEHRPGTFLCAGCQLPLFSIKTKFDSGTGWPSFYAPLPNAVETSEDSSLFESRTEAHCRRCGGHLGHVFPDGPPPTGQRYCMNGVALVFRPE
jgi:peptide-methionine (R)-S-oxide reductase